MKAWKKNEMWQQIIRKLREKKLSECENWGKLGWEWIGKSTRRVVYAGGVMAKPTSAVYPKNTQIQIHKWNTQVQIHKYRRCPKNTKADHSKRLLPSCNPDCHRPYPDHSSCYQYANSNLVKILNQWKSEKGWMQIQNLIKPWGRWGENLRGILLLGPDSSDKKTH